jgi:flagellar basal body-associated protein FliL
MEARGKGQEARSKSQAVRGREHGTQRSGESGQAVVIALVALAIGILLVAGFLYFVTTSQRASQAAQEQAIDRYSTDAGVEHAIWRLTHEPGFTTTLESGDPATYTIDINGQTVAITVTRVLTP